MKKINNIKINDPQKAVCTNGHPMGPFYWYCHKEWLCDLCYGKAIKKAPDVCIHGSECKLVNHDNISSLWNINIE